jgi:hypothetical protein
VPLATIVAFALVVLVADAKDPTTEAMRVALREVLDGEVDVRVEPTRTESELAEPAVQPAAGGATARVQWDDSGSIATLVLEGPGQVPRRTEVHFSAADAPAERGRTLGYVLASWLQPAPPAIPDERSAAISAPPPRERPRTPYQAVALGGPPAPFRASLAAYGQLAVGVAESGASTSYGAGAVAALRVAPRWALQARFEARTGRIGAAQATTDWMALKAGAAWTLVQATARLGLALQLELGLAREEVTHFSADDPRPVELARLIPLAAGSLQLGLRFAPALAGTLDVGSDLLWGTTSVFVHGEERAELSWFRPIVALGFVAGF